MSTLSDPYAASYRDIDEIDPRLRDIRYHATAGEVTEQDNGEFIGELTIEVEGIPTDLSAEANDVLENELAPFPVGIQGQNGQVRLVEEAGKWLVCSQSSKAAPQAVAVFTLRPVLAALTPQVVAPPLRPEPGETTPDPSKSDADSSTSTKAEFEALAVSGCGGAVFDAPADQPLVTCSLSGDEVFLLGPAELSNHEIKSVTAEPDTYNPTNWVVQIETTPSGATILEDLTGRLADLDSPQDRLAVVLDGLVQTAPFVAGPIPGGEVRISGNYTSDEARDIEARLTE